MKKILLIYSLIVILASAIISIVNSRIKEYYMVIN